MVTQLQPDVRAYLHGGEVIKRYIKVEEVACEYGFSVEETEYMDAFRMGIKSKDDLRRYSLEELEEMCPKDKRLFVRLKKLKAIYG